LLCQGRIPECSATVSSGPWLALQSRRESSIKPLPSATIDLSCVIATRPPAINPELKAINTEFKIILDALEA